VPRHDASREGWKIAKSEQSAPVVERPRKCAGLLNQIMVE